MQNLTKRKEISDAGEIYPVLGCVIGERGRI